MGEDLGHGVTLHCGDCLDVLAGMDENSVDAVVTDPPYHLTAEKKGGIGLASLNPNSPAGRARIGTGFMGKAWDGGDVAFKPTTWQAVARVMKPGAHLLACGGTRTYHRMVCAIEDAGFEVRDAVLWIYGQGVPKGLNISKEIDRRRDWKALPALQGAIRSAREALGISQSEAARRIGLIEPDESPTAAQWEHLKGALGIDGALDGCFEAAECEITGTVEPWTDRINYAFTGRDEFRRDKPATDLAAQWDGWSTTLKPAVEIVCVARKPISERTVAANVVRWGTGAININGCRVAAPDAVPRGDKGQDRSAYDMGGSNRTGEMDTKGRWPANVIHDGSAEVLTAFPDAPGQQRRVGPEFEARRNVFSQAPIARDYEPRGDSGSAARFFYTAKADADDRLGSKHPTVKPVDLIQHLARLVTPPDGLILDPFAGTGTAGEAAFREGFRAILIELEPEYQADIRRRMGLAFAGPGERKHESLKARGKIKDHAGPLFGPEPEAAE